MISRLVRASQAKHAIYVGDTDSDRLAAATAGVDFAHAAYGFGGAQAATVSFGSFEELVSWFRQAAGQSGALRC